MIKELHTTSQYVTVGSPLVPNVYPQYNAGMVGQVRYSPNTQTYEIYDGSMWQIASTSIPVGLTVDAELAIQWAIKKRKEEADLQERLERHPGLKDAWEKFQIMDILSKEDERTV